MKEDFKIIKNGIVYPNGMSTHANVMLEISSI